MLPMLRDPASFLPAGGNDTTCAIIYDAVYKLQENSGDYI